MTSFEFLI